MIYVPIHGEIKRFRFENGKKYTLTNIQPDVVRAEMQGNYLITDALDCNPNLLNPWEYYVSGIMPTRVVMIGDIGNLTTLLLHRSVVKREQIRIVACDSQEAQIMFWRGDTLLRGVALPETWATKAFAAQRKNIRECLDDVWYEDNDQ